MKEKNFTMLNQNNDNNNSKQTVLNTCDIIYFNEISSHSEYIDRSRKQQQQQLDMVD